jgi:RNA polymerase sigma-70 factor, ECF subfamily
MDDLSRLALLAREGDEVAFAALVRASQHDLHRFCAQLTDTQRADDLVQEVYLRAWDRLATWGAEAPVKMWLLGIARHVVADEIRRRSRRRRIAVMDSLDNRQGHEHIDASRAMQDQRGDSHADRVAADLYLRSLVAQLDPDQAMAFVLTQLIGLSYQEAADVCATPVGTIRSRVARARATLADSYRREASA